MPYDLKIRDVETNEIRQQWIKDLQEFREILSEYKTKIIEVDLVILCVYIFVCTYILFDVTIIKKVGIFVINFLQIVYIQGRKTTSMPSRNHVRVLIYCLMLLS